MKQALFFRPHHFLCTLGFKGLGYDDAFVANYQNIATQLKNHPDTPITVTPWTDSICQPCPRNLGNRSCISQTTIEQLDTAHSQALQLKEEDQLTWRQAKARMKNLLNLEIFGQICAPCSWQKLGICKSALQELLSNVDVSK